MNAEEIEFDDMVCSTSSTSKVLLVAFDHSQREHVAILRDSLALRDDNIEVFDLHDADHLLTGESKYPRKLERMLDCLSVIFLITSPKLSAITDPEELIDVLLELGMNAESCKVFMNFFNIERKKSSHDTKLAFLSFYEELSPPHILQRGGDHFYNICFIDSENAVHVNETIVSSLVARCAKPTRNTFPPIAEEGQKKCRLM